jgi:hypothetical protein
MYKICCNDLNIKDIYVGHTTNFIKRKAQHKHTCNNPNKKEYNLKVYSFIRDNGGWNNWSMIEIEKYNCNDRNEAISRERHWYEILQAKLNVQCPNQTHKEYRDNNKEKLVLKYINYYKQNKDQMKQKQSKYYEDNKELCLYKIKKYREKNEEIIKEKKNKLCICEICGANYTHSNKSRHERSIFHLNKINK